jgi:hypothetical protein
MKPDRIEKRGRGDSMSEKPNSSALLFAKLHEGGWHSLSGEEQDALIASGWHPGPRPDWTDVNDLTRRVWIVREGIWAERVVLKPREYAALIDELHALRNQTVTKSADLPITGERPRDVGAPGAAT